jgi:hypothetical protein
VYRWSFLPHLFRGKSLRIGAACKLHGDDHLRFTCR